MYRVLLHYFPKSQCKCQKNSCTNNIVPKYITLDTHLYNVTFSVYGCIINHFVLQLTAFYDHLKDSRLGISAASKNRWARFGLLNTYFSSFFSSNPNIGLAGWRQMLAPVDSFSISKLQFSEQRSKSNVLLITVLSFALP